MTNLSASTVRSSLITCALALGVLASTSPAAAQARTLKVDVPFAFEYGSQHLSAGTYQISLEPTHMVLLRSSDNRSAGFAITFLEQRLKPAETGSVIFHRYGDQYFLSDLWIPESSIGRRFVKTRQEKQAQIALQESAPTNVELAINVAPR